MPVIQTVFWRNAIYPGNFKFCDVRTLQVTHLKNSELHAIGFFPDKKNKKNVPKTSQKETFQFPQIPYVVPLPIFHTYVRICRRFRYETEHMEQIKKIYPRTNKKNYETQILHHNLRHFKIKMLFDIKQYANNDRASKTNDDSKPQVNHPS